jgi:aspartate 1-decarboxylase
LGRNDSQDDNINTGARFETYAIEGAVGEVKLNGAAARLAQPGDLVIVMSHQSMNDDEARRWDPRIVKVDPANRIRSDVNRDVAL